MKAIMISIKPKYVADILNHKKTIEVRKVMPKCDLPIDVYIYCTKDKKYANLINRGGFLTGMVVAKFTLKHIDNLSNHFITPYLYTQETCLTWEEILNYRDDGTCYAWHISNLVIFDKPKELSEFRNYAEKPNCQQCKSWQKHHEIDYCKIYPCNSIKLTKAPQSFCYIEVGD